MVFVDYILIYSKSEEEHEGHLRIVIQALRDHKLYAKFSNCEFFLTKVKFFGHEVLASGVFVDPEQSSRYAVSYDWQGIIGGSLRTSLD